jgi:hypothetical protein
METAEENQSAWAAHLHKSIVTLRFPRNERFREAFIEVLPAIVNHVEGDSTWEAHLEAKIFSIRLDDEVYIDSPLGEEEPPMRIALRVSYSVCLLSRRVLFEARVSKGGSMNCAQIQLKTDSPDEEWVATNVVSRQYIQEFNQARRIFRRLHLRDN